MFLFWLLWITVGGGGFYLGTGYALALLRDGFDLILLLNTLIYLGAALYGLPKFLKLIFAKI